MSVKKRAQMGIPMPGMLQPGAKKKPLSRIMFDKFDTDGSGAIGKEEFKNLCYDLGHFLSDQELELGMQWLDKDGSGEIEYDEFVEWWKNNDRFSQLKLDDAELERRAEASATFRQFDADNSGSIDADEFDGLHVLLVEKNMCSPDKAAALRQLDSNGDGEIQFNEYIEWLERCKINEEFKHIRSLPVAE